MAVELGSLKSNRSRGINLSLLKLGPITQVTIGIIITALVLLATATTVVVVVTRIEYKPPTANNDSYELFKQGTDQFYVMNNDYDVRNDEIKIIEVSQPPYGSVSIQGNGKFLLYNAPDHYAGKEKFKYTISNSKMSTSAFVEVLIKNHAPEPQDFLFHLNKNSKSSENKKNIFQENGVRGIQIKDIDNDELFITSVSTPSNGTVSFDKKHIYYQPLADYNGVDSVLYTISDGNDTASGKVDFIINNNPPVAVPDSFVIPMNTKGDLDVLANDYDVNHDVLTITSIGYSSTGKATVRTNAENNKVEYFPARDLQGVSDSFEYVITDGWEKASTWAVIKIVNIPPTAGTINVEVPKNGPASEIQLTYADQNPGQTLTITLPNNPTPKGTVQLIQTQKTENFLLFGEEPATFTWNDYKISYTPKPGELYEETLQYVVSDGIDSTTGFVNVKVVNTAPIAKTDYATCGKNLPVDIFVLSNDTDPNGDQIRLVSSSPTTAQGGSTTVDNNKVVYTPKTSFTGVDTFEYTIEDVQQDSSKKLKSTGSVVVSVNNEPPVANADSVTIPRGSKQNINVLQNDNDPNGDELSIHSLGATTSGIEIKIVKVNQIDHVEYTASTSKPYIDKFTYTITDGQLTSTSTVTVTVVNTPPTCANDVATVKWNGSVVVNVLDNDSDENTGDKDILTVDDSSIPNPSYGTVLVINNKQIRYTPNKGYVGSDTFSYKPKDNYDSAASNCVVSISVTNTPPTARDDNYNNHLWGTTKVYDVLANDEDPDGDKFYLKAIVEHPNSDHATVEIEDGKIKFTAKKQTGEIKFKYSISDYYYDSVAQVTVNVYNNIPVASNDQFTAHWNSGPHTINVLENDNDADSNPIKIKDLTAPDFKGTLQVSVDSKSLQFTIDKTFPVFTGVQTATYTITDDQAVSAPATVQITLTNNDVPTAENIDRRIHWRTDTSILNVLTRTTDNDGDNLNLDISQLPNNGGSATVKSDSNNIKYIEYKQTSNFKGIETFNYRISDGAINADGTVTFDIYNTAPQGENFEVSIPYRESGMEAIVDVLSKASDEDLADKSFLHISSVGSASHGTATKESNKIKYVPDQGFKGEDSFTYAISDGLETVTRNVNVKILSAPLEAQLKEYKIHWRTQFTGSKFFVMKGLTDKITGKTLQLTQIIQTPKHGSVVILEEEIQKKENITYTQNTNYIGPDEFKLNYTDNENEQTVTVIVDVYNNVPTGQDYSGSTHWRNYIDFDLLSGVSVGDIDSQDTVTVVLNSISSPTTGSAVLQADGKTVRYTPNQPPSSTSDTFTFSITDGLAQVSKKVDVTITNKAPTAQNILETMHWSVSKAITGREINILSYVNDANGDTLTVTSVADPNDGIITKDLGAGKITYKPKTGVHTATDSFNYVVSDGYLTTTKTITVVVFNNVSVAQDDSYSISYTTSNGGTIFKVMDNDSDPDPEDSGSLTISKNSNPSKGTLEIVNNGKEFKYTPQSTFVGEDSFTYSITDGVQESNTATVSITVTAPNPSVQSKSDTIKWDSAPINYNLLDGSSGVDLKLKSVSNNLYGSLQIISLTTGEVQYDPNQNINYDSTGTGGRKEVTDTITFTAIDKFNREVSSTLSVTIRNTPPTGLSDVYSYPKKETPESHALNVLQNDSDADDDTIKIVQIQYSGSAIVSYTDSQINYKPVADFSGDETIKYKINDGQLTTDWITVTVSIENYPPICQNIAKTVVKGTTESWDLITGGSCTDSNGDTITLSKITFSSGQGTPAKIDNKKMSYTHNQPRSGQHVITYYPTDGTVEGEPRTVTVTINNRAPTCNDMSGSFGKADNPTRTFDPLGSNKCSDLDSTDSLSLASLDFSQTTDCLNNAAGTISIVNGKIEFKPKNSWHGTCSVDYVVTDNDQDNPLTAKARLTVTVQNQAPIANNDEFSTKQGEQKVIPISSILQNDEDPDETDSIEFVGLDFTKCDQGVQGYCHNTQRPYISGDNIIWPVKSTHCQTDKIDYIIQTTGDPTNKANATISLRFTDCICYTPADIVFVVDGSGSIVSQDWTSLVSFTRNLAAKFAVSSTGTQVGLIQYATYAKIEAGLQTSSTALDTAIKNMVQQKTGTGTLFGLQLAAEEILDKVSESRKSLPKVIILITDGVSNLPLRCESSSYDKNYLTNKYSPRAYGAYTCKGYYQTIHGHTDWYDRCRGSPNFPTHTCEVCYDYFNYLQGCSDIIKLTNVYNSRRKANGSAADWKIVPVGVGEKLTTAGEEQLKQAAWDGKTYFRVGFDDLETIKSKIVDIACDGNNL